jgi:NAD(P)H dehydrogenase (quinone)
MARGPPTPSGPLASPYHRSAVQVLVVFAHPDPDSFGAAVRSAAVAGLERGGHEVRVVDLYAEGFRTAMTTEERIAYHSAGPLLDPQVQAHADLVRWAEALVFVYPTWWSGLPAILKGWLERVFADGVAFTMHPVTGKVVPALGHVRVIVGVTTYGSPRWSRLVLGDSGRRTLHRALWLCCPRRTRRLWLGFDGVDGRPEGARRAHLANVERRLARLRA